MDVRPQWFDMIGRRTSCRHYDGRPVPEELHERLEVFCDGASAPAGAPGSPQVQPGEVPAPARVGLVDDPDRRLFEDVTGDYGAVAGTRLAAVFVGRAVTGGEVPAEVRQSVGYLGEALVLEATRLGLGTCWIAGSFDAASAARLAELAPGEVVVAVTPLGYPARRDDDARTAGPPAKASARLSVEKLAPGILDGTWPAWAVAAVQAARLAPSGGNRQPWRFRLDDGALVMGQAGRLYWTAPIDFGIARLHVELGAQHEGVTGSWTQLPEPDVARFTPAG